MDDSAWENVEELPDELDDDTAAWLLGEAAEVQGTDYGPSTENGPKWVIGWADANDWRSGDGRHRISPRKQ